MTIPTNRENSPYEGYKDVFDGETVNLYAKIDENGILRIKSVSVLPDNGEIARVTEFAYSDSMLVEWECRDLSTTAPSASDILAGA